MTAREDAADCIVMKLRKDESSRDLRSILSDMRIRAEKSRRDEMKGVRPKSGVSPVGTAERTRECGLNPRDIARRTQFHAS
jgi:hypothetical protein